MSIEEVAQQLGETYRTIKRLEKTKEELRREFFEYATKNVEVSAKSTDTIKADDEEQALRIAQRQYHKYEVLSVEDNHDGTWNIIFEENPEYKEFKYVNPVDGFVYQKIIAEGAPTLDDEAIQAENPELWDNITTEVVTREVRPLENLSPDDLAALRPYITMPTPQTRLAAPRKAKQEELDE